MASFHWARVSLAWQRQAALRTTQPYRSSLTGSLYLNICRSRVTGNLCNNIQRNILKMILSWKLSVIMALSGLPLVRPAAVREGTAFCTYRALFRSSILISMRVHSSANNQCSPVNPSVPGPHHARERYLQTRHELPACALGTAGLHRTLHPVSPQPNDVE